MAVIQLLAFMFCGLCAATWFAEAVDPRGTQEDLIYGLIWLVLALGVAAL